MRFAATILMLSLSVLALSIAGAFLLQSRMLLGWF
jgi:hypothetical protein